MAGDEVPADPRSRCGEPAARSLHERLATGPPLLLDGATGTELERRGVHTGLPLWSTHALLDAPQVVETIHREYAATGAEVLTANTFRTQRRTLAAEGMESRAAELTALAVQLARRATGSGPRDRRIWIAGSVAPLEDCYRPDLVPNPSALEVEHAEHVDNLVAAGVDLLLVETMNTIREAAVAARAARRACAAAFVSFVTDDRALLLSGESLADAVEAILPLGPLAVLVNCVPPSAVGSSLAVLRRFEGPFGVYANLGAPVEGGGWRRAEAYAPDAWAEIAEGWQALGARVLGGCCGTTPDHVRAMARRLKK